MPGATILFFEAYHAAITMQYLTIREIRGLLGKLDQLVEAQQELVITRNKKAIARVLPIQNIKQRPLHAELRRLTECRNTSSAELIRKDRDER